MLESYYEPIDSINKLLGEDGYLRLPEYLIDEFVVDDERSKAISSTVSFLTRGKNVLIIGEPGTGKTALMAVILKKLMDDGFTIARILDGAGLITNEHREKNVILFYDDLPRLGEAALQSIFGNKVTPIIATARKEELSNIIRRKKLSTIWKHFEKIEITRMSRDKLQEILLKYTAKEGVKIIDNAAIDVVIEKAEGLPVYIYQLVRELKVGRKNLNKAFAEQIPQGMLDYIDDILWRVLDEHPDRYKVLLLLRIIASMFKYTIHKHLYNYLFAVISETIDGKKMTINRVLFNDLLTSITRYLFSENRTYSYRLPHDSWADVLKGLSKGPMSGEISIINTAYPEDELRRILLSAAKRAAEERIKSERKWIRDTFLENIKLNLTEEELQHITEVLPVPKSEKVSLRAPTKKPVPSVPKPPETKVEKPTTEKISETKAPETEPLSTKLDRILIEHLNLPPMQLVEKIMNEVGFIDKPRAEKYGLAQVLEILAKRNKVKKKEQYYLAEKTINEIITSTISKKDKLTQQDIHELAASFGIPSDLLTTLITSTRYWIEKNGTIYNVKHFAEDIITKIKSSGKLNISRLLNECPKHIYNEILSHISNDKSIVLSPDSRQAYSKQFLNSAVETAVSLIKNEKYNDLNELSVLTGVDGQTLKMKLLEKGFTLIDNKIAIFDVYSSENEVLARLQKDFSIGMYPNAGRREGGTIARYKTVLPSQNPGEFVIRLRFINRGEVAVENVTIIDYIPLGYNLVSWEPEELKPEVQEIPKGINVMWTFKRIEKGNEVSLKYVIQGKGTYVRREPMIVFGKEPSTTQEVPKERETEE